MAYNFLIVDDSTVTRAVIKRTIVMAGLPYGEIHEAANGLLGLKVLRERRIDLVLADLNMPEMGGVEMTHQIFALDPALKDIPVIVVSAEPNVHRLDALRTDGIQGYLRKPFTPEGVRDAVYSVIGGVNA